MSDLPAEAGIFEVLDAAFATACEPLRRSAGPIALLFSGGVDSGLLALELRARPDVELVTIGRAGSADLAAGEAGARRLRMVWRGAIVTPTDVVEMEGRLGVAGVSLPRIARSVLTALALAISRCDAPIVACGQGADELFLGYAHFRGLTPEAASERADEDLGSLRTRDWPAAREFARSTGRELIAPYLADPFVEAARAIPVRSRGPDPEPKALFRRWARHRGLPESIAGRPKKALQYGSGIDRWVSPRATPRGSSAPET